MARIPALPLLKVAALAVLLAPAPAAAAGSERLSLRDAAIRRDGDFAPARMGKPATLRGRVASVAVRILAQYEHVGIEQDGYGFILEAPDARLRSLKPGDDVEASGELAARGGLAVLQVSEVRVLGRGSPPAPAPVSVEDLMGFRHLGRLVVTEGSVLEIGENTAGAYLLLGRSRYPYKLFLSHSQQPGVTFSGFAVGDTVRAVGIASQYCAVAPFNRWFQLTVVHPSDVVRTGHTFFPPTLLAGFLTAGLGFGLVWWTRERRLRAQREALRRSHQLGEDILGASSAQDILRKGGAVLPAIFGVTGVHLYLFNPGTKMLDKVPDSEDEAPVSIVPASPGAGMAAGAVACFQNRMVLSVPDSARSPFPPPEPPAPPMPKAVLFVPMFTQGEAVGVFAISHNARTREFSRDEQGLAQHLGNQIAVAVRLLEQSSVREQLFRTEKLAAVGRLISGVVNELQAPLASICNLADVALSSQRAAGRPPEQIQAISVEARKASDMVSRLVSFAAAGPVEARAVDLNRLLRSLAEFRERDWKARGIRVRLVMTEEPLPVLGSQGQLEQVFLDLIVHSEQALQRAPEKVITLRTMRLARRVLVEIGYTGARDEEPALEEAAMLGLGVCRGIIAGHGGELRAISAPGADPRFEVELPRGARERLGRPAGQQESQDPSQPATALVIEPDEAVERHLLALLTARGYRVVPVESSDTGLDLAHRLRFDVVFCSVRAPGLNWVELSESLQTRVEGFVLLSDGYDPELAADFEGDGRFVLAKPIDESHLDRALQKVEHNLGARAAAR